MKAAAGGTIISRSEPAPVVVENAKGKGKCVIVCDHASNLVPRSLNNLGLGKTELKKHIAWDPGTQDIGRYISAKMDAPLVLATYSRLVVDLNRGPDAPECMRPESDHIAIPGNENLSPGHKKQRLDEIFWPYHRAIDGQLQRFLDKGVAPLLLSLHSFTPQMDGFKRPWHIGVLWNKEEGIARRLVDSLRKNNPQIRVGENEPYSLKAANVTKNTVSTHAESRGLPYVIVEFRQDLVGTAAGARKWAGLFLKSLQPILDDPHLYRLARDRK
ncbi:MAG TPA: N-formylglutamate amidohydrolase [Patescibacteria group bacterium]|nr:N-formylglutamate amidohydrolase [Patescibacteria group bacterium]